MLIALRGCAQIAVRFPRALTGRDIGLRTLVGWKMFAFRVLFTWRLCVLEVVIGWKGSSFGLRVSSEFMG